MEDHPLHRHLGLQHLEHVPRDRLALAILVRRENELVGVLERPLQVADDLLLAVGDHVLGCEVVVDVDGQPRAGQITDVPDARLHVVARAQEARDGLALRGRLHDDERFGHWIPLPGGRGTGPFPHLRASRRRVEPLGGQGP